MTIDLETLEAALQTVLEQFRAIYGDQVVINSDVYWTISCPAKTDMNKVPELEVGSLADHHEAVQKLVRGDIDPDPSLLRDIGELLKQCGEAMPPVKQSKE